MFFFINSSAYTKEESNPEIDDVEENTSSSGMSTSELILNVFRTALDVVRKINKNRSRSSLPASSANSTAVQVSFINKYIL